MQEISAAKSNICFWNSQLKKVRSMLRFPQTNVMNKDAQGIRIGQHLRILQQGDSEILAQANLIKPVVEQ